MVFIRQESIDEVGRLAEADKKAESNKLLEEYCRRFAGCLSRHDLHQNRYRLNKIENYLENSEISEQEIAMEFYKECLFRKEHLL